jgi:hypothetical protein
VKHLAAWCLVAALLGCHRGPSKLAGNDNSEAPSGLYWGRWGDVPDGARVQVWLHGAGARMRGTWELPPWHGEITGEREADGQWSVVWREEPVVAAVAMRIRRVKLRRDPRTGALRGALDDGAVELVPAAMPDPRVREGMWLGRWTGLPHGMAVETVLSRSADGRWHAAYRYQEREGSFEGEPSAGAPGTIAIRWREVSSTGRIAQGAGLLAKTTTGLFGTYGVGERNEGTGVGSLEPMETTR